MTKIDGPIGCPVPTETGARAGDLLAYRAACWSFVVIAGSFILAIAYQAIVISGERGVAVGEEGAFFDFVRFLLRSEKPLSKTMAVIVQLAVLVLPVAVYRLLWSRPANK